MVDDILSVAKALLGVQQKFLKTSQEQREQTSAYFQNISKCLKEISNELQAGRTPFGKYAELETYASELSQRIRHEVGTERAAKLEQQLLAAAAVKYKLGADPSSIEQLELKIEKLEQASGVFGALANSVVLSPRSNNNLFLYMIVIIGLIVAFTYTITHIDKKEQSQSVTAHDVNIDQAKLNTPAENNRNVDKISQRGSKDNQSKSSSFTDIPNESTNNASSLHASNLSSHDENTKQLHSVTLHWQEAPQATSYNIYRKSKKEKLHKIGSSPTTVYVDTAVPGGTVFYYGVTTVQGSKESDISEIITVKVPVD